MVRVAINGFGRIGRCFFRAAATDPQVQIVAVNDLGEKDNLLYLLTYDSVYGRFNANASTVQFLQEKDPSKLPWKSLRIDVAVESTGAFDSFEKASAHLTAGARKVVITAPVKDTMQNAATVLVGVNEDKFHTCNITSNASCTTNSASPLIAILDEALGVERALLNTVHSYTATQSIVDAPVRGEDKRRGRAAAINITPSSTGAAVAVTKAYEQLAGKFDGIAVRVPTPAGSLVDITFVAKRDTSAAEVNKILGQAAVSPRWKGIFTVTEEPLVSSDIVGQPYGSIADLAMTRVVGNLVKVLAWYDNEMGYAHTLLRHVQETAKY